MRLAEILRLSRSAKQITPKPKLESLGERVVPAIYPVGMSSAMFGPPMLSRIDVDFNSSPREMFTGGALGGFLSTVNRPFLGWSGAWGFRDWFSQSGEATHFDVRVLSLTESGEPARIAVIARDAANMPVRDFTGTIHFASSDSAALLPEDYTFTARDRGVHVFEVTPGAAGELTIDVTQVTSESDEESTGDETVAGTITLDVAEAPVVAEFSVRVIGDTFAGDTTKIQVVARTEEGRPVRGYSGTVHFESTDESIILPEDYTFTAEDRGIHVFEIATADLGELTITVTEVGETDEPVEEEPVTDEPTDEVPVEEEPVTDEPTDEVPEEEEPVTDEPTDEVPVAEEPVVDEELPTDETVTDDTQTEEVAVEEEDTQSVLPTGSVTFEVVEAPVATHFELRAFPSTFVGDTTRLVIVALDASNRPVKNFEGTVHLTSTDPDAVLAADYTFTKADRGVHVLSIESGTVGTQTLTITDTESAATGEISIEVMDTISAPVGFNFGWWY